MNLQKMKNNTTNPKQFRCCFTGHRPEKLYNSPEHIKELLKDAIEKTIADGYYVFISGMARGVDLWAAELVIEEKKRNPSIKLMCVSPYFGFEKKWNFRDQLTYNYVIKNADYVKYLSDHYSRYCFHTRNTFMVNNCNRVIAAFNGERGGTYNTINYAKNKNLEIINILNHPD